MIENVIGTERFQLLPQDDGMNYHYILRLAHHQLAFLNRIWRIIF